VVLVCALAWLAAAPAASQTLSLTSDAVAHWRLDEASGSRTAVDSSGHGHNGIINAGLADPVFTTDMAPFAGNGGAMMFRAFDVVNAGDVPDFRFGPTDPMSLTVWVKQTQSQGVYHILGKRAGCSDATFDYQIAGDPYLQVTATSARRVDTGQRLPLNTWTHIAVTYDGVSTLRIYRNGVEAARSESFVLPTPSSAFFSIGSSGDCSFGQRFQGLIDDVRIYNRTLSPSDVAAVMGGAGSGPVTGSYGGSVTLAAVLAADNPAGKTVTYSLNGVPVGSAVTDGHGLAFLSASLAGIEVGTYPDGVVASFEGDASTPPLAVTATLIVTRAVPTVTVDSPPIVSAPYTLVAADIHASADVPGMFAFSPAAGSVFTSTQPVVAHFMPADTAHYTNVDTTFTLYVGLSFQSQPVNTAVSQTFTIANPSPAPMLVGAGLLSGPGASSYTAGNSCLNVQLAHGASCAIGLTFAPSHSGVSRADFELMVVTASGASLLTTSLYGEATGETAAVAVPQYHATVLDDSLPPNASVASLAGFNNHDQFVGLLFYPTGPSGTSCTNTDTGGYYSTFVYSNSAYLDLGTVPGTLFNGPDPCTGWGWPTGMDDAGNVVGISDSADFAAGTIRYDGSSMTYLRQGFAAWPSSVLGNGVVLFTDRSFFFDGQLQQPTLQPFPIVGPGGVVDYFFHTASMSFVPVQEIPRVYGFGDENAGGVSFGTLTFGPGNYTPGLFQNGVATAFAGPGATSVNSAGQAVGNSSNGPIYWDRRSGVHSISDWLPPGWSASQVFINDAGHILTLAYDAIGVTHVVRLTPVLSTPAGTNVVAQSGLTTLTFSNVSSAGTTTVEPIDASTTGTVPGGFAISDTLAFEIHTTAAFSGPVTVGFVVPGPMSEPDFNQLRVLHNENGSLVDVTTSRDYARMTIYATTTTFSPFYIARRGNHILPLFDTSKAYKAGSTVPVKLQVLSTSNANLSSPTLKVKTRKLLRVQDGTATSVIDAGNSNPDSDFRFDPTIGGTGGYIFNLSTKGLKSGRYGLSLAVGHDTAFVYNVTFEVK